MTQQQKLEHYKKYTGKYGETIISGLLNQLRTELLLSEISINYPEALEDANQNLEKTYRKVTGKNEMDAYYEYRDIIEKHFKWMVAFTIDLTKPE